MPSWSRTAAATTWTIDRPKSIGRVRSFFGNIGVLVRMYCYIRSHGPAGLRRVAENAVLNANYLLAAVKAAARAARRPLHARVRRVGRDVEEPSGDISAMDIAKRLLDYGFHAPTVYFPLIVREAMMIEPTETESKATLDAFAEALCSDSRKSRPNRCTRPRTPRPSAGPTRCWRPASRC